MIVVTGGAGFIGSNLVAALEARGEHEIAVCDRLESGDKWRNLGKRELAAVVPPEGLFRFLDRHEEAIETVFHLGAISSTTEPDADLVVSTNFTLSQAIWDWCATHGKRLLYASSASVYGSGPQYREVRASERPLNIYGYSKFLFDQLVRGRAAELTAQVVGLRYFNVYGPNEAHKGRMASVALHAYQQLLGEGKVKLFAGSDGYRDGEQRRDFVYVEDASGRCRFLPLAFHFTLRPGEAWTGVSTGGGGFGDPLERPVEQVRRDVRDGLYDRATAAAVFGVVLTDDPNPVVLEAETRSARDAVRRAHVSGARIRARRRSDRCRRRREAAPVPGHDEPLRPR